MPYLNGNREHRLVWLSGLILALGTLACFWPVHHFDFVSLDDGVYVYRCRMVKQGLSWPGLVWSFQSIEGGNWNPLVWLSHMADCEAYGLTPGGHHVTNLLLHMANGLLLFLILKRMTGAIWRSGFAAAIFAWHPMHVESVAWISERKDLLSTWFWLLTIGAYARYANEFKVQDSKPKVYYALALIWFALGLMCKPMLVTLPFVLLLLDYWPLQRADSLGRRLLEKLPFMVLSLAASALTIWAQHKAEAMGAEPLLLRLENAEVSYAIYLGKFIWPVDLAVFYPYPDSISIWRAGGAVLVFGVISWAVIRRIKQRPYLAIGWFWFLGTLVPVIGLLQVGMQGLADRYTYVPYIGLALMASWGMAELAGTWPRGQNALMGSAALGMGIFLAMTSVQVGYWRNSASLFEHALKVTSGNYVAHDSLGNELVENGKLEEAIKHFHEVIRLKPLLAKPYNNLGKAYALQAKLEDAMAMFSKALTLDPKLAEAHYNLGNAFVSKGKMAAGITELKKALDLKPDDIQAQKVLADALLKTGKVVEAQPYCEAVVQARPEDAHARFNLGWACQSANRTEQALANYKEAMRLAPDAPECLNALAWIYAACPKAKFRNGVEAVHLAEYASQITKRQDVAILDTLAAAYAEAGKFDEAIKTTGEIQALALSSHDNVAADTAQRRLVLYEARKPYRDEP